VEVVAHILPLLEPQEELVDLVVEVLIVAAEDQTQPELEILRQLRRLKETMVALDRLL
jgi:mannitol/fructose-specific phosphotransferase system IIA component (Ntr-type)